ncbi:EscN/YscN/HrcN family type III secretion system ATPase [Sulfobacillus thermotolerans]|uniref:EscN/YscN/HrcN family type III secretion system ATPase n=1 Tax=Sulfobacillus thermotolerans TaxID=338644 RepID=A0ABM6RUS5_9FIRM|nr:EscN/YscN/HrcN family type III secretion system ATPase [Sulfobacillus thermotolerans]
MGITTRIEKMSDAHRFIPAGRIVALRGASLIARGVRMAVGEMGTVALAGGASLAVECVGFLPGEEVLLTPYHDVEGLRPGLWVKATGHSASVVTGPAVLGRLLDGLGQPLDGGPAPMGPRQSLRVGPVPPLSRTRVHTPLWTGIKAIDGLLTLGKGQRTGIFAGAGYGKTTLLQLILQGVQADVMVVALIGERGKEVAEFYREMDMATRQRTVLIAATSDMPAILRLKAAWSATVVAETFRKQGLDVLLVMDSLTRVAMAQREIGLETGELPASRGYTPSVFHLLPRLLERPGAYQRGSLTGIYTVLVDGVDAREDPLGDSVRGLIDGHILLSRDLAEQHHFPAIDVVKSLSRLMPDLVSADHLRAAARIRRYVSHVMDSEDLRAVGAYVPGRDAALDEALARYPHIRAFLDQEVGDIVQPHVMQQALEGLAGKEEDVHDVATVDEPFAAEGA